MADYTVDQLFGKLERADAAGDTEAAHVIADEIRRLQGAQMAPRNRRGSRAGATMAGSLNTPNVQGKNVAPPPPKPKGNAVTRALGDVGARNVMQGAYGLWGSLGGDALNEYVLSPLDRLLFPADKNLSGLITGEQPQQRHVFGIGNQTYRDAAAAQADEWGMARPVTPTQRVVADIGEGLTGTGLTMGIGGLLNMGRQGAQTALPTIRSKLGEFLTANPVTQTVATTAGTTAASTAREMGANPLIQLGAGVAGGMAPSSTSSSLEALLKLGARGKDPTNYRQALDDFAALGATPSAGQASGLRRVQGPENLLGGLPTAEGVVSRFAERQSQDIGKGLDRIANSLSRNPSAENAGRAIEQGAESFRQNIGAVRKALYWQVDKHVPRGTSVSLTDTWRTMVSLTTPVRGAESTTGALINPVIAKMRENLAADVARGDGKIPYEALKALRSRIGEELDVSVLQQDRSTAQYRQLYAALSRDMEAAAKAQGPAAERAARRANTFTRVSSERLEDVKRIIDKNGGPEAIYNAALTGTRDGGTTIRKVMQSIDKSQQRAVTAAFLRRMGMANPGAQDGTGELFSARTFLTNWNKVSPEAKRALFDRHGPKFSEDMDRIARVADNIDKGAQVYKNPSGTGSRLGAIGYVVALAQTLGHGVTTGNWWPAAGVAGGGVGGYSTAQALTNPKVVRWLADTTRFPAEANVLAQIQTLRQIGEEDGDEDVVAFANALEEQAVNQGAGRQ